MNSIPTSAPNDATRPGDTPIPCDTPHCKGHTLADLAEVAAGDPLFHCAELVHVEGTDVMAGYLWDDPGGGRFWLDGVYANGQQLTRVQARELADGLLRLLEVAGDRPDAEW